jgi:dipeptidyl aminopeptidase/acylaminoacyl peptidase
VKPRRAAVASALLPLAILALACGSGSTPATATKTLPTPGATAGATTRSATVAATPPGTASAARPSSTPAAASAPARLGGPGTLLLVNQQGIFEFQIGSATTKQIIAPSPDGAYLMDPALSADASTLAYISQPPPKVQGKQYDAGSDLWAAARDGSNPHAVFTHDTPNQLVRFPKWQDAGHVLAIVQEFSLQNGATKIEYWLERVDVATGERTKVLKDVLAFDISPDGKRVVYAKLAPQTGETLMLAGLAGGPATTLAGVDQNLAPFNFPAYSHDGATIAFASADQTGARAGPPGVTFASFPAATRLLDGLPEDIWTISAAGGTAVRVADLKEDVPSLTWSGDDQHLYVFGSVALYDVNLKSGAVNRIGEGAYHGQVIWAP